MSVLREAYEERADYNCGENGQRGLDREDVPTMKAIQYGDEREDRQPDAQEYGDILNSQDAKGGIEGSEALAIAMSGSVPSFVQVTSTMNVVSGPEWATVCTAITARPTPPGK
ncbi:hypothetical protein EK21DRAFT_89006 [Setomelanomma holmii]|uniref:Uncharacterized protein n=1 Tax=Setomelanomma holmii TaxID=210430 RepID=A0A9P4HAS5_9PLEO|nr:hypothetical protein EK21DRAFT_89006 [Setomelanomma holmii]